MRGRRKKASGISTSIRILALCVGSCLCTVAGRADTVVTGTVISSPSSGNGPENAFDSDFSTYYASDQRSLTWIGLDLGTPHIISRIGYSPRQGYASRMLLGLFEGANSEDFSDAVPLAIVPSSPAEGRNSYLRIDCSRAFRYVRYVGPNDCRCNVSELIFYGHPAKEGETNDSHLSTLTSLPVVSIRTTDGQGINSRHTWVDGTITIIWDDGASIIEDSLRIRGRGNASWSFPKKPYRIKLDHKARPLGLRAKTNDWTLINNYGDKTLIRNLVAFNIAERLGMKWTPQGRLVDVVVNGEYQGTYQFCDQVEVQKRRVDVAKIENEDVPGDPLTGGYLIELDAYSSDEPVHFTSSVYSMPVAIKYPDDDEITSEQKKYIKDYLAKLENAVKSANYKDEEVGYPAYLDVHSFVQHFLTGELAGNTDTYWSVYMSKEREDPRFVVGPVWDFDIAFDNDNRTHSILSKTYSQYKQFLSLSGSASFANGVYSFVNKIINSTEEMRTEEWSRARYDRGLTPDTLLAFIDSLASVANKSQQLNFTRWPILSTMLHQNFQALGSYTKEVDYLKKYVKNRFAWMDSKVGIDLQYTGMEHIPVVPEGTVRTASGMARLEGFPEGSQIEIHDITGRKVFSASVTEFTTDVPLSQGVSVITVKQPDGVISSHKVSSR